MAELSITLVDWFLRQVKMSFEIDTQLVLDVKLEDLWSEDIDSFAEQDCFWRPFLILNVIHDISLNQVGH